MVSNKSTKQILDLCYVGFPCFIGGDKIRVQADSEFLYCYIPGGGEIYYSLEKICKITENLKRTVWFFKGIVKRLNEKD